MRGVWSKVQSATGPLVRFLFSMCQFNTSIIISHQFRTSGGSYTSDRRRRQAHSSRTLSTVPVILRQDE